MLLSAKDDNLLLLIGGLLYTVIKNESLLLKETKDQLSELLGGNEERKSE